jgi:hypothetical protein
VNTFKADVLHGEMIIYFGSLTDFLVTVLRTFRGISVMERISQQNKFLRSNSILLGLLLKKNMPHLENQKV